MEKIKTQENLLNTKERKDIYYLLDKRIILMTGEYDQYGKHCSRVMIGKTSYLVDRTPLQLLDETLMYIGFDLRGATSSAKSILGIKAKCPVMINSYQSVCLFPTKSPQWIDCIWFNPEHIVKTKARSGKTEVELSNGYSIIIGAKLLAFNNKVTKANQLRRISMERGLQNGTLQFYLEPKKGHQLLL
jgi:competence protein ComK